MIIDPSTAQGQLQMCRGADRRVLDLCKAFNEVQTGPNPLTPDEVRLLIRRRPERYSLFERWASPETSP